MLLNEQLGLHKWHLKQMEKEVEHAKKAGG